MASSLHRSEREREALSNNHCHSHLLVTEQWQAEYTAVTGCQRIGYSLIDEGMIISNEKVKNRSLSYRGCRTGTQAVLRRGSDQAVPISTCWDDWRNILLISLTRNTKAFTQCRYIVLVNSVESCTKVETSLSLINRRKDDVQRRGENCLSGVAFVISWLTPAENIRRCFMNV